MTTLLFDIDGTLVRTGGAGKAAMEAGLRQAFGIDEIRDTVPYSGRTDRDIGRELLSVHDIDPTPENQTRLTEAYLGQLPVHLTERGGEVCPGIEAILKSVHGRQGIRLGLLTGNVRRGAKTKLGHYGLWDYFAFGGFGDDHYERDDVARSALQDVERHLNGPVNPAGLWVIGDTPLDVKCARAIGAKAMAVATGWHSLDELTACRPDVALKDLAAVPDVLKCWGIA